MSTFYYLFYFEPVKHAFFSFLGLELIRNQGWFWEPGVLQVYLNILLYLEGFIFKRKKVTLFLIVIAIFFYLFNYRNINYVDITFLYV